MVSGLLMDQMRPADYWLLRSYYTFDESEVPTVVRAWQYMAPALLENSDIRLAIRKNKLALQYLTIRAIKPKLLLAMPTLDGTMSQKTISNPPVRSTASVTGLERSLLENQLKSILDQNDLLLEQ